MNDDEPLGLFLDRMRARPLQYVLDDQGEPVPEPDIRKWAEWMETCERQVAADQIGPFRISTVFLGVDHSFHGGLPVLWETMVFGLEREMELLGRLRPYYPDMGDEYEQLGQRRYMSRIEALQGHADVVCEVLKIQAALSAGRTPDGRRTDADEPAGNGRTE